MKVNDNYFIGITLPPSLESQVESSREWMKRNCGCRSGMKTKAHITLIPPFRSEKRLDEIKTLLTPLSFLPFNLSVSGFGSFGERTIFARDQQPTGQAPGYEEVTTHTR